MQKIRQYKVGDHPVPGYRLTAFLGSGGFGEVWKATAPGGTEVAIKINNLGMRGALKEFRSLRLVKKIQYPNLVPILAIWLKDEHGEILDESAFDQLDGEPKPVRGTMSTVADTVDFTPRPDPAQLIIAMGLGHKSLSDRLEECRAEGRSGIPADELLKYFRDAARAIDYLNSPRHQFGNEVKAIQHCDIKPPNILIVGDAAQVCDFGLAREADDLRQTSLSLSPVYAAPEIISTNIPSATTDQYSLAVSYLELRTGELPFPQDASASVVIQRHLAGQLDLSRLSEGERQVIRKATSVKPTDRYATASEMVAALQQACFPQATRGSRRSWLGWAAACLVLLGISGALAWQMRPSSLRLPAGFVAAADSKVVDAGGITCPDEITCTLRGLEIPLRLVHGSGETKPFYIMKYKVANREFARFADENPSVVAKSIWEGGPCGGKFSARQNPDLPVFGVTCVEAALFARWIGGELPTVEQWDEAAGRHAGWQKGNPPKEGGPYREPWESGKPRNEQVAVGRGELGPLPVGKATHDESVFGCRDMAGNGSEWTSSTRDRDEHFSPDKSAELMSIILRGRTYLDSEPLRFKDLEPGSQFLESPASTDAQCDIGFRVVVTVKELQDHD